MHALGASHAMVLWVYYFMTFDGLEAEVQLSCFTAQVPKVQARYRKSSKAAKAAYFVISFGAEFETRIEHKKSQPYQTANENGKSKHQTKKKKKGMVMVSKNYIKITLFFLFLKIIFNKNISQPINIPNQYTLNCKAKRD